VGLRSVLLLVTVAFYVACAATAAPPMPTPTPAPTAIPSYPLTGMLIAPSCFGGHNIIGANVTLRDEGNNVVGAATTAYGGDSDLLAYRQAQEQASSENTNAVRAAKVTALWNALVQRGTAPSDERPSIGTVFNQPTALPVPTTEAQVAARAALTAAEKRYSDASSQGDAQEAAARQASQRGDHSAAAQLYGAAARSAQAALTAIPARSRAASAVSQADSEARQAAQPTRTAQLQEWRDSLGLLYTWATAISRDSKSGEDAALQEIFGTDDLSCHATFSTNVGPARFYQIRIGTHDGPTYSFEDMAAAGWNLKLGLGQ
jgi:hypothetical protein